MVMPLGRRKLKGLEKPLVASAMSASVVLSLLESDMMSVELACEIGTARDLLLELYELLDKPLRGGRGLSLRPQLPTLRRPKANIYESLIGSGDEFKELCGWTPTEFHDLLRDVQPILLMARDVYGDYTPAQNALRRKRAYKHSPAERLLAFLVWLRTYQSLRKFNKYWGLCPNACWADFKWLREQLVQAEVMTAEIRWPTAAERALTRDALTRCGALPPGFEHAVAIVDGTKDSAEKPGSQAAFDRDHIGNKGYGKTHMLATDLFGMPIYCEAGLRGNRNDRGLWKTTDIYRNPDKYLADDENLLMDGVFQGNLHRETEKGAIIPASALAMANADAQTRRALRACNRKQRYLRTPIEQTNARVKEYKIVGNILYRGDVEDQGLNWVLCTQLTARIMRVRGTTPRGEKWRAQAGELEDWEQELGQWLYMDPASPHLY